MTDLAIMTTTGDRGGAPPVRDRDDEGEAAALLRWEAVLRRDPAADGAFVYAVATTGVYCRPSCPSRRANRANVTFHDTPAAAEGAGFRPCRRCRPDEAGADPARARAAGAAAAACRLIERAVADGEGTPTLAALAAAAGLSRHHFHRLFKAATGVTPGAYAAARKARLAEEGLAAGGTVIETIYGAGYGSPSRFYEGAAPRLGMRPGAYRDGGRGEAIRFAVGECSLGAILVAATGRGVCAIRLGDDPGRLVQELQDRFPAAELAGGDPAFERWVAQVVGFVEAPGEGRAALEALPLDVRGTAFQERVWRALRAIPPGGTASYAEVAARIGLPKASRAVARACASNPVALAIPCHRVVRADGGLSGYRWGVVRKRELLAREAAFWS